jgi:hypothetical protein
MIPLLIAGAVVGLGAHACASVDNDEAREKNIRANEIIDESNRIAQEAKRLCQGSIDSLAKEKTIVLQGNMRRFVRSFSQIKPVNFSETGDLFEIAKFNKNELTTMESMVSSVQKVSVNDVVGGVSGTALAVGAADVLTGGSILGAVQIGGLAVEGAALGAVAAPIFAITGIFSASEAAENLEKAKSNLSKARAYQDECETYSYLAQAVSERCDLFYETLNDINMTWFTDAVNQLEMLVNSKKNFGNFIKNITGQKIYTRQEMQTVASAAALAKMIKTIIDTNILDNNGHVTEKSEQVILQIQDKMNSGEPLIKISEPEQQQQQEYYQTQQQPQQVYQQPQYQQQTPTNMKNSNAGNVANSVKTIYNPNGFVKFIMWAHTVFYAFCGVCLVFAGTFVAGVIWFAAGLMMCPKINKTMKFWPRFGLMVLLIIIGALFA